VLSLALQNIKFVCSTNQTNTKKLCIICESDP